MDPSLVEIVVTSTYGLQMNPTTGLLELVPTATAVDLRPKTLPEATATRARRAPATA